MFESREEYTYPPYGSSPPYSGSLLQELYDERPHHHAPYYSDVKLEEHQTPLVPSHHYLPASSFNYPPPPPAYSLSPHTGLPVQHTDDAASKETQYLRRRCFNCHTTEPPSWRRSTLNPGKIVCNKCGLYERTHLRPRPLRFDELRAGNKARKSAAKKIVKKDPSRSPKDWDDSREYLFPSIATRRY
ncbi:hypothetical protein CPB85DRAFT_1222809 [Mucidula mucida]|nr:hypothetical protein CPB85DRAFT_1222809 [Mucidula mucida]